MKLTAISLMTASALGLASCSDTSANQNQQAKTEVKAEEKKAEPAVPVEVSEVTVGNIDAVYSTTTALEAENEATVVAKSAEIITKILVEEGDVVEAGQVLAQLNTDKLSLELKRSEVELARMKADLQRNKKIFDKNMISSDAFERMKFDYQAQLAAYDIAKLQLEYATIRAPIAGVVAERSVKVGNMVSVNQAMFKVVDFDPLHAVVYVPERELTHLKQGQLAVVNVDAQQQALFDGKVKRISPIIDSATGTFKVTVEIANKNNQLKPGMFGRVGVVYARHENTLMINKEALLADEQQPTVFKLVDDKAVKTTIEVGFEREGKIEVTAGLAKTDYVVTAGQNSLKNDSKVEVLNRPTTELASSK
jgi:membrane fusion protein (multidrug efflux system)